MKRYLARQNPRRDENEPDIVRALRKLSASVYRLSGKGIPDLLWGWRGQMGLLEVKMPLGPRGGGSRSKLNEAEQEWWDWWQGPRPTIVRAPQEALDAVHRVFRDPDAWGILKRASPCGIATEGLSPLEVLDAMADRIRDQTIALSQGQIRGEELEAENRELRKRLQERGG